NTVDGKTQARGPGSLIYEPYALVHQWGNPGDEPLIFLAFNINPEGVAAVLPGAPAKKKLLTEGGSFDPTSIGEFESWWQRTIARSSYSAEPAFSAAASFGICALTDFPFGSLRGIQIGGTDCLVLMIRSFNP